MKSNLPQSATRLLRAHCPLARPAYCILLLILLCPAREAFSAGIPDPGDPGPTNALLNSWSFTDTTNLTSDSGAAPASFTNLTFSDLGDGAALVVDSPNPAWLQFKVVEENGRSNLCVDSGSLMGWYAPNWSSTNQGGTGPGEWSRLIEVGSYTEDASYGWWSVFLDPAGVNLYFSAQGNDGSQTNYLTYPIAWTTNRWHLIALSYSTTTNCALYIDGDWVTNGPPMTVWPGPDVLAGGFYIGSDSNGLSQAHGMFDQLTTYANVLDPATIADTFSWWWVPYYLNPDNIANLSQAPSTPQLTPTFAAIAGPGYLTNLGVVATCLESSKVWLTNVVATLVTNAVPASNWVNLAFTIWGGSNSLPYDVFASPGLVGKSITNATWTWMGQGYSCTRYQLTNLPASSALVILGTPQDSDLDGLTDAYEVLVSHTNPLKADTSGDGLLDGWKVLWGLNGSLNNPAQPGKRANYGYDPASWLKEVTGLRGEELGAGRRGQSLWGALEKEPL